MTRLANHLYALRQHHCGVSVVVIQGFRETGLMSQRCKRVGIVQQSPSIRYVQALISFSGT